MATAAELALIIKAEGVDDATKKLGGLDGAIGKIGAVGKAASAGILAGGAGLAAFATMAVSSASDVAESQNKVNVVFGESAGEIDAFAATAAGALGQTKGQVLEAAGTFGNLLTALGSTQPAAAAMSQDMIKLAADLGSFNNADPTEVLEALRSGLTGEAEPMKRFGVALNEVAMKQAAVKAGLGDNVAALSEAQKMQLRYNIIMEQTKTAQGDFANTSDGMANSMKIIKSSVGDAVAEIGAGLQPAIAAVASSIGEFVRSEKFSELVEKLTAAFAKIGEKIAAIDWASIMDAAIGLFTKLGDVITWIAENPAIAMIGAAIVGLMAVIGPLLPIIGGIGSAIGAIVGVVGSVVGALGGFGAIIGGIAALFNPVTLAIGAVVAIIVGLKMAWDNNLGGIQEKTAAVVEWIKGAWDGFVGFLSANVETIKAILLTILTGGLYLVFAGWQEHGEKIKAKLSEIGAAISTKWEEFKASIATKLAEIGTAITEKWEEFKQAIADALEAIWSNLRLKWDAFLREITDKLEAILGAITKAWDDMKAAISGALDAIKTIIIDVWNAYLTTINEALERIKQIISAAWEAAKGIIEGALGAIGDTIRTVIEGWKTIIEKALQIATWLWDTITGAIGKVTEAIGEVGSKAIEAGISAWKGLVGGALKIADWIKAVLVGPDGIVAKLSPDLAKIGSDLIDGIGAGIRGAFGFIENALNTLVGLLPGWLKDWLGIHSPSTVMMPIGAGIAEGIAAGFLAAWRDTVLPAIKGAVQSLGSEIIGRGRLGFGAVPIGGGDLDLMAPPHFGRGGVPGIVGGIRGKPAFGVSADAMRSGKGGFVAASKSNYWQVFVQRHGVPDEASARKMAEQLGIPLPDWLEEMYSATAAGPGTKLSGPGGMFAGIDQAAGNVQEFAAAIEEATLRLSDFVMPSKTPPEIGIGGAIGGPGGGIRVPWPIIPPGGGGPIPHPIPPGHPVSIEPKGAVTIDAPTMIVPSLSAVVNTTVNNVIQWTDAATDRLATLVVRKMAEQFVLTPVP